MKVRLPLLLSLAFVAAACSRQEGASTNASAAIGTESARVPLSGGRSLPAFAAPASQRFARTPDRGQLMAYPATPVVRRDGAYTWYRADISEAHARAAIGGELSIPLPSGEQLRFRYARHQQHPSGDWTWVGSLNGDPSQRAIVTFGEKAAFGSIDREGEEPLRLTVRDGQSWLIETDSKRLATIINSATRPTGPGYLVPPRAASGAAAAGSESVPMAASASSGATVVDVAVGYTSGFAASLGGASQATTRVNFLAEVTNEAYATSQINARVRVVHAREVNYPDATKNETALEELTGHTGSTKTTPHAAFSELRAAREQFGADLVALVRKFNDPENDGCGVAWINGGGAAGRIAPGESFFGYSVSSDGEDLGSDGKTYFCRTETFAHELGHNMGAQHDRDTADGDDNVLQSNEKGVFEYALGYKTGVAGGNFFTVMAYGEKGQFRYRVFSNPRVTACGDAPCGIENQADNARALSQTIPQVAAFRATVVPLEPAPPPSPPPPSSPPTTGPVKASPFDVNGDGRSDVLLRGGTALAYWGMSGTTRIFDSYLGNGGSGWTAVAFGNFDAAHGSDVLWANGSQVKIWFNMGGGNYHVYNIGSYGNGWQPFAAADVNGDGKSDILFRAGSALAYWLLDGAKVTGNAYAGDGGAGFRVVTTGDFTGDGADEVVWASGSQVKMWVNGKTSGFSPSIVRTYGNGYVPFAAGYVDGDSGLDLLFRNGTAIAYWRLNGPVFISDAYLGDGGAGYVPFAVGDYNGDGKSDLGWHNGSTIKFWMNNGVGNYTAGIVGNFVCCYVPEGGLY